MLVEPKPSALGKGEGRRRGRERRRARCRAAARKQAGGPLSGSRGGEATAALVTAVVLVFVLDRAVGLQALYLHHSHPKWWQPLTATLCHASAEHLSSNLFLLYTFGREVEAEGGPAGLLASFFICGTLSALSNLALLPHASASPLALPPVSLGASGAVFGLFSVTVLTKLTPDPRRLIEAAVLGQFVLKQLLSESRTVLSSGGSLVSGSTSHVAHLSGAVAGVLLVLGLSRILSHSDQ